MKRFKIFVGRDWYNDRPLYKVIDKVGDYVGEWHKSRKEAQEELKDLMRSIRKNPMKKKTRKKVVRRKRRSMREKRVMKIKRGLMKRAKKLHLGAKRTGAYVYGTLRRIVGNRRRAFPTPRFVGKGEYVWKKLTPSQKLRFIMESPRGRQSTPRSQELFASRGWNFLPRSLKIDLEARFANVESDDLMRNSRKASSTPRFVGSVKSKILGNLNSYEQKYRGFTIIVEPNVNTTLATWTDGDILKSQRYSGYSTGEVFDIVKSEIDDLIKPSRPGMLRGNPMSYHVGGLSSLGAMGEQRRKLKIGKQEQAILNFARKYPGWHGFNPRKHTADVVRRLSKKGLIELSDVSNQFREIRKNPPMYAHRMMSHRTHGLSLKQMMKLYRMVSSGNPKAVMFARRTLGIPMSESLSQVKAVVYHHVLDLKGKI